MLTNEANTVCTALAAVTSVQAVTRGWPKTFAALPCIAVALASESPEDYRDNTEYLTELEYYVRIFAATPAQCDTVAAGARSAMETLGYTRTFAWEDTGSEVCQYAQRYRKTG